MKTFVHHEGAMGDVLLSLPCLRRIAVDGPLHFAGRPDVGMLLREACVAAETSASGAARYAPLSDGRADGDLRAFLARFDRAVVFTVDTASPLVQALRGAVPATTAVAVVPPQGSGLSAAAFRASQCGAGEVPGGPLLPLPALHRDLAAGMLSRAGYDRSRPVLAVHPGSGGEAKRWPFERFLAVIELLVQRFDPFLLLLSGPAEDEALKDRLDAFVRGRSAAVHYADADLVAVAALLSHADLYLGNDSGVTHLAAAVGAPVLALFGPTDRSVWGPQGAETAVLAAGDLAGLAVDAVASRAAAMLTARFRAPGEER